MNIAQTQQLLTFLWGKFPNGRVLSEDDRRMTVLAYFDELWMYSLQDAIAGARRVLREQPRFIPAAPEISARCKKTIDHEPFLTHEYYEILRELKGATERYEASVPAFEDAFRERAEMSRKDYGKYITSDRYTQLEAIIDSHNELKIELDSIRTRMERIELDACHRAYDAYDNAQRSLAFEDLQSLGYERTALDE